MGPLVVVIIVAGCACLFAWVASLITGETSWVDRLWSIVPVIYMWIFAGAAGFTNVQLDVMAAIVTVWGIRLTFNFARKGGYSGVEDYRWPILREKMKPWQYQVFNVIFIVLYQNFILVLITLPAYTAYEHRSASYTILDAVLALVFLLCTVGETVADQQQWNFQTNKYRLIAEGVTPKEQFVQTGLFRYSRHPNFFFEQAQWWIIFFLGAATAGSLLQWTIAGPVLLTLLFLGSTKFTESITLSRYPEYAEYQERTSSQIPWFPRKPASELQPARSE